MKLVNFRDATYSRRYTVDADDLQRAVLLGKATVPLRRRDGTKLCQIDRLVRRGEATSLHLSYVPRAILEQACRDLSESNFAALPEVCAAWRRPDEELVGLRRGEIGYYRKYDGKIKGQAARAIADSVNQALGVTLQQREAMVAGRMTGWFIPAAHPACPLHAEAKPYTG